MVVIDLDAPCLIDALRALTIEVPVTHAGPCWALREGNRFLQSLSWQRILASLTCLAIGEKYILNVGNHFVCLRMF